MEMQVANHNRNRLDKEEDAGQEDDLLVSLLNPSQSQRKNVLNSFLLQHD